MLQCKVVLSTAGTSTGNVTEWRFHKAVNALDKLLKSQAVEGLYAAGDAGQLRPPLILFANAKPAEELAEYVLDVDPARNPTDRMGCPPDVLSA